MNGVRWPQPSCVLEPMAPVGGEVTDEHGEPQRHDGPKARPHPVGRDNEGVVVDRPRDDANRHGERRCHQQQVEDVETKGGSRLAGCPPRRFKGSAAAFQCNGQEPERQRGPDQWLNEQPTDVDQKEAERCDLIEHADVLPLGELSANGISLRGTLASNTIKCRGVQHGRRV